MQPSSCNSHIFPHIGDRFLPGSVPTITGPFKGRFRLPKNRSTGELSQQLPGSYCRSCRAASVISGMTGVLAASVGVVIGGFSN